MDSSAACERRNKLEALAKLTTASLESEIVSIALVEVDVFRESNSEGEGSAGEDDRLACCFDRVAVVVGGSGEEDKRTKAFAAAILAGRQQAGRRKASMSKSISAYGYMMWAD